jgi:hypothetical protein
MTQEENLKLTYDYLVNRNNGVNFTFDEFVAFKNISEHSNLFEYRTRNGEIIFGCRVVYFPLPYSKNLMACIEYFTDDDEPKKVYDECQIKYLELRVLF